MTEPLPPPAPPRWQSVLLALTQALSVLPASLDQSRIEAHFLQSLRGFAKTMPVFHFFFLRLACLAFEILPLFFGLGAAFYTQLPVAARKIYFERWLNARCVLFRDIAKMLRSLACVFYFSSPEIWRHMDYDPHTHIRERIQLRETLLKK